MDKFANSIEMRDLFASMGLVAEPRYRDYVRRFKSKPGGPQKPIGKEEWESKVLGKGKGTGKLDEGGKEDSKKDYDKDKSHAENTSDTKSKVKSLAQKAKDSGKVETHTETTKSEGKGGTNEHKQTVRALPNGKAVVTWTDTFTPKGGKPKAMGSYSSLADINDDGSLKMYPKTQKKHQTEGEADSAAKELVSGQEKGGKGDKKEPKKDEGKKEPKKDEKPKGESKKEPEKSYSKSYAKPVTEVMDKHSLTDDDADEVKKHKGKLFNPKAKVRMSDAERFRKFLSMAKPETKERMKGMSPAEFMKILGAIMDDEGEGGGKTASVVHFANPQMTKKIARLTIHAASTFAPQVQVHLYDGGLFDGIFVDEAIFLLTVTARDQKTLMGKMHESLLRASKKLPFPVKLKVQDYSPKIHMDGKQLGSMSTWYYSYYLLEKDTGLLIAEQVKSLADLMGLEFQNLGG